MRVTIGSPVLLVVLLFSVLSLNQVCFGQLPSSRCDAIKSPIEDCVFVTQFEFGQDGTVAAKRSGPEHGAVPMESSATSTDRESASEGVAIAPVLPEHQGFHWRGALKESFTFLVIEQAYVVHTDFNWVVSENGVPFNHFWRDYKQSLSAWVHSGWNDGDPNWFGYVGHPIQGALTGFIQIQNDPQGERLEFSRTKAYWWSRFKASLWNVAYSTQWNLGPLSEVTVEKYGTKDRAPWNYNGTYPCSRHCLTGVGQIDIVMTPLGGTGWLVGEDFLDKEIARRLEDATQNHVLIDTVRCALNPIRGAANILHGKQPWYRASRAAQHMSLFRDQKTAMSEGEVPKQTLNRGEVFFGYSHAGTPHCQATYSDATIACDPFSVKTSNLAGWSASFQKTYLHYFGAVADFGGQYGAVSQRTFLFGVRGEASMGRFRPFAQALFGAVHAQENGAAASRSETSFAAALGGGLDFRLTRRLSWRNQVDELKSSLAVVKQYSVRLSSGLAVRF